MLPNSQMPPVQRNKCSGPGGCMTAFLPVVPIRVHQLFPATRSGQSNIKQLCSNRRSFQLVTGQTKLEKVDLKALTTPRIPTPSATSSVPASQPPSEKGQTSTRMFSNVEPAVDGSLKRTPPSELACTALVGGTMIGCGILALPTVASPPGFVPSSSALLGVWAYMATTGLLISEVTINSACALGRARGISMLSLGALTLGPVGTLITTASYLLLHYAILTAYIAQGGTLCGELFSSLHIPFPNALPHPLGLNTLLFSMGLGGAMYLAPGKAIERLNITLVIGVIASFFAILVSGGTHIDVASLLPMHWDIVTKGQLIPVLFVSCVYQNVISTISMRLEGDRRKIRRAVLIGSGIPVAMFMAFDAVMMGSQNGMLPNSAHLAVELFSLLAVATSFIGFVEALTELCADARQSVGLKLPGRWPDFAATLVPPVVFAGSVPDVFLKALDIAGTYGIAVLFGVLPAAMAWRNRDAGMTQDFGRMVGGGKGLLAIVAAVPLTLIGSRLWEAITSAI